MQLIIAPPPLPQWPPTHPHWRHERGLPGPSSPLHMLQAHGIECLQRQRSMGPPREWGVGSAVRAARLDPLPPLWALGMLRFPAIVGLGCSYDTSVSPLWTTLPPPPPAQSWFMFHVYTQSNTMSLCVLNGPPSCPDTSLCGHRIMAQRRASADEVCGGGNCPIPLHFAVMDARRGMGWDSVPAAPSSLPPPPPRAGFGFCPCFPTPPPQTPPQIRWGRGDRGFAGSESPVWSPFLGGVLARRASFLDHSPPVSVPPPPSPNYLPPRTQG